MAPHIESFLQLKESGVFTEYIKYEARKLHQADVREDHPHLKEIINDLQNDDSYEMACKSADSIVQWHRDDYMMDFEIFIEIFETFFHDASFSASFNYNAYEEYYESRACDPTIKLHIEMCIEMCFLGFKEEEMEYKEAREFIDRDIKNVLNSVLYKEGKYMVVLKNAIATENKDYVLSSMINIFLHARNTVVQLRNRGMMIDEDDYRYIPMFEEVVNEDVPE